MACKFFDGSLTPRLRPNHVRADTTSYLEPEFLSMMKNAPLTTKSRNSESVGRSLLTTPHVGHRVVHTSFSNVRVASDSVPLQA